MRDHIKAHRMITEVLLELRASGNRHRKPGYSRQIRQSSQTQQTEDHFGVQRLIAQAVLTGTSVEKMEQGRHYPAPVDEDERSALWLYAGALQQRHRDGAATEPKSLRSPPDHAPTLSRASLTERDLRSRRRGVR